MKKIALSLMKVILISCVISLALMCLFSFIMLKIEVSDSTLKAVVIVIYAVSTFVSGLIMGKVMENRKFLWGMGCGLIYFALVLIIALVVENDGSIASVGPVVCLAVCLAGGTIGGMVG